MVKHAKNKKRRANRFGRTKLKNRNYTRFKPTGITDPIIKANWDPTKSAAFNLSNMGLRSLPNSTISSRNNNTTVTTIDTTLDPSTALVPTTTKIDKNKAIELFDIPTSDNFIPRKTKSSIMLPVSIDDQKYITKCFTKYGNDYSKMAKDHKLNDMQHTETYLKKLGARFLLLSERERRVDVPDCVKHLVHDL